MASVERRSGKRGDVYVVRYRDDQQRQRSKSFSSHIEAIRYSNKVEVQLAEGDYIDPRRGRETFGDFHARWVAARTVSPSRGATERSQAGNHILPYWGSRSLATIRPLDVDSWIKNLDAGAPTKEMVLAQFKLCLDAAVREQLIRMNPALLTKAPAVPRKRVTRADVLEAHELESLVSAVPDRWKALIYLSGWIGWRWSEAMGLQLRHIEFGSSMLMLGERTIVESEGVLHIKHGGKTDAATRVVPLPQPALAALRWHVDAGFSGSGPSGSVFTTASGHTPFRSNFRRIFSKAIEDAELEGRGLNMRQLRHTAASLMLSAGLDLIDVQQRLGHAKGSTTLDIYARVLASRRDAGTALLETGMGASSWTTPSVPTLAAVQLALPASGHCR